MTRSVLHRSDTQRPRPRYAPPKGDTDPEGVDDLEHDDPLHDGFVAGDDADRETRDDEVRQRIDDRLDGVL